MTKHDVCVKISKKTGQSDVTASEASVNAFMDVVKDAIKAGEPVYLRGFGTFLPKKQAAKTARNISKGTSILIPARTVPSFKASKEFKKSLLA
jgi:DNA-binding protein HU-beta